MEFMFLSSFGVDKGYPANIMIIPLIAIKGHI